MTLGTEDMRKGDESWGCLVVLSTIWFREELRDKLLTVIHTCDGSGSN